MENEEKIIENLIAGGIIGAALGAILTNKNNGTTIGALAGAVLMATYNANQQAQKTNVPVYVKEDEVLYEIKPGGIKTKIKSFKKNNTRLPKDFQLK